jgi:gamma-tubulin complex component 3
VEMVPKFIDDVLVDNIFLAGKSVNFLRKCCNDTDWLLELKTIDIDKEIISSSTFDSIKQWFIQSSEIISKKLITTMFDKFNFKEHMFSIKRYLLLGQGDFLQYLMDLISSELSNPASSLYEHNLMSFINTAVGASNA